jgi:hypothetical protein
MSNTILTIKRCPYEDNLSSIQYALEEQEICKVKKLYSSTYCVKNSIRYKIVFLFVEWYNTKPSADFYSNLMYNLSEQIYKPNSIQTWSFEPSGEEELEKWEQMVGYRNEWDTLCINNENNLITIPKLERYNAINAKDIKKIPALSLLFPSPEEQYDTDEETIKKNDAIIEKIFDLQNYTLPFNSNDLLLKKKDLKGLNLWDI